MKRLIALILSIAAIAFGSSAHANESVKIAAIAAKSGDAAATNNAIFQGIHFAVEEINSRGGLLGKRVEIIEYDNESTALGSRAAAKKAVEEKVLAVIGASWSEHSIAAAGVLQEAKIPMISPQSTNPDVTKVGDYIFRICYIDSFQGLIMAEFARNELKAQTAAVLVNIDRKYSEALAEFFTLNFVKKGGKILYKGEFLIDVSDYTALLEKVKPLQPDIIYLPSDYRDSSHVIGQARKMGIKSIFLGGDAYGVRMYDYIGKLLDGNYYTTHWHKDDPAPHSRNFVKNYEAKYGEIKQTGNALAYDSVMLLSDAVRRSKSLDRKKIRDALAETKDFQGVTGKITYGPDRNPVKSAVILKFENGKVVYIKTINP